MTAAGVDDAQRPPRERVSSNALASAHRRNAELIADLPSEAIVNFGMARYRNSFARGRAEHGYMIIWASPRSGAVDTHERPNSFGGRIDQVGRQ